MSSRVSIDLTSAIVLFAIAAVFLLEAGEGMRDWLFPRSLAYTLTVIGVVLAVRGIGGRGPRTSSRPFRIDDRRADVALFIALSIAYVVLIGIIGFWAASVGMLVVASLYLGDDKGAGALLRTAAVVAGVCALAYFMFMRVFFVPLPKADWLTF